VSEESNPILGYADSYRSMARVAKAEGRPQMVDMFSVVTDLERNIAPLFTAAQSELAALREELAKWKSIAESNNQSANFWFANHVDQVDSHDDAKQRLAAAEQRNAELLDLLRDIKDAPGGSSFRKHIEAALKNKSTESGASE
jgi:rubrerythrin